MNDIRFGFADTVITPSRPDCVYLDGYGHRMHPAVGVRDELHAKVAAITDGETTFLLFSLDLIGMRRPVYELLINQITALCGVPRSHIALACTHTHSAPATGILDELPINTDYFAYVGECCGRAALAALERATPGSLHAELLPEQLQHSFNRRGRDVIDRSMRAAAFRDTKGNLRGLLCSASCHAVINTSYLISADFLSVLNEASTDACPYLFFQGRGADINPYTEQALAPDDFIRALGSELTDAIAAFLSRPANTAPLQGALSVCYEDVTLPMMKHNDLDALRAAIREHEKAYFSCAPEDLQKHFNLRELQWLRHMLRLAESNSSFEITVPLQLLKVGDAMAFAFVPFELLTLTGNKIEQMLLDAGYDRSSIYVCGYSNITESYLAPVEELPYGGYEAGGGASHWYKLPHCTEQTEPALLRWFADHSAKE